MSDSRDIRVSSNGIEIIWDFNVIAGCAKEKRSMSLKRKDDAVLPNINLFFSEQQLIDRADWLKVF